MNNDTPTAGNFIRNMIAQDVASNKHDGRVYTRFPPEPNGYLHIGHAKSICLNFGLAQQYNGNCNLRFDDTNPEKESEEYMRSIQEDVSWLGFNWTELHYASDYFEALYQFALELIDKKLAYVDSLSADQMREYRGTLTEAGKSSPHRDRPVAENRDLFKRMKNGEFADGEHALRARIDMSSPNLNMRDPVLYRIRHVEHYRTGNKWCIYPMYDYTHCLSDALEHITHSLCTLEFEDHRPLYDWVLDNVSAPSRPEQTEFSRLNLQYTVLSKRKLIQLVEQGHVSGWDDPRMPTISGIRRRGYTPAAVRDFCERIGVTKKNSTVDMSLLENSLREDLNPIARRAMAVLKPLKLVITNYPKDKSEKLTARNHPKDESFGTRELRLTRELYVDHDDFMEDPPRKFFRLGPGREVRLRYGYCITCNEVIKDDAGNVIELHCTYDPETGGGQTPDGRKVKGIIHWVSADDAVDAEIRLYDRLFNVENPLQGDDYIEHLNPESLTVISNAKLEPSLAEANTETPYQFERVGFFTPDSVDHTSDAPVFNRTVTLRDSWAKQKNR
ncbi:MAG: glutamine--tRNA ligase/YqeY domain fusion protein [Proteobacteria bacterium]|jgi:glutaminyl-tRNA synthetase|nr:glutamine--tRNA ligase/YqeY domain fusion protein [Pseudomonadota bacterium]